MNPRVFISLFLVPLLVAPMAFAEEDVAEVTATEAAETAREVVQTVTEPVVEPEPEEVDSDPEPEVTPPVPAAVEEATPAPPVRIPATTSVQRVSDSAVSVRWNEGLEPYMRRYRWQLELSGYLRLQYRTIQDDPNTDFGQNDGFVMANARFEVAGRVRSLGFRLQFDGAVDRMTSANSPDGEVVTRLRDAVIFWQPLRFARLEFGQFKAPYDIEELAPTRHLLFVDRSVGSRGVQNVEGYNVDGLSIGRQVGFQLTSDGIYFGDDSGPGIAYALAVTNGQDANRTLNDNDLLAYYGRLAFLWGDMVSLGGGAYLNNKTVGDELPNRIDETDLGFTGDLQVALGGLRLNGSLMYRIRSNPDLDQQPDVAALAWQAQLAYQEPLLGFQPAFRVAWYDPTFGYEEEFGNLIFENDTLMYWTIGLNYNPVYPVRLMLNYTITQEQEQRELRNNRFDAVLQAMW